MLTKTRFEINSSLNPELAGMREELFFQYLEETADSLALKYSEKQVVITPEYLEGLNRLCPVLDKAIHRIVSAYFSDERIKAIYQLDQEFEHILKLAEAQTYRSGFYRPDFLYDQDSQAKICEIGARYPLNGWMISYYQNLINEQLLEQTDFKAEPIPNQKDILRNIFGLWDLSKPLTLVHDDEKGTEIFFLKRELLRSGTPFLAVKPQDLELISGEIRFQDQTLEQFILEMDREELKKFKPEVLKELICGSTYFNDVRTLILVHDKRILAVLWDEQIMQDYLTQEEYTLLRQYLIPSFVIKKEQEIETHLNGNQNLILKLNSGGRGIGAYIKRECSPETWESVLKSNWKNYLIQHFLEQENYEINGLDQQLVGVLLCANGKHFGPGIFRGSSESVVNVHGGRAKIFPVSIRQQEP